MSSGCGDVLSLEDLRIAKLHQLFEAEVITGKQGGVASGADIDYATNQVTGQTQKTLPAVLRDSGFSPVSWDFSTGGVLSASDRNKVVYDPVSKAWYSYAGALPVTVPAGFNPVGNVNWKPQTDPVLRDDLASAADGKGDAMVAVKQPYASTVQRTQHQKNAEVISIADFGAVPGADCTAAIDNACAALRAVSVGIKKTLYVPNGPHPYNGLGLDLPPDAGIEGESQLAIIDASANTNSGYLIKLNGWRGRVNNLALYGNPSNPNLKGISSQYNTDGGGVTNCLLQDFTYGIDIDRAWYSVYENIRFRVSNAALAFSGAHIRIGFNQPTLEVNNINFRNIWMSENQLHSVAVYGPTQNLSWTGCSFETKGGPRIKFYTTAGVNTFSLYGCYIEGGCGPDLTYFLEGQSTAQQVSVYDCMFRLGSTAGQLVKNARIVFGAGNWSNSPNVALYTADCAVLCDSGAGLPFFGGGISPYGTTGLWSGIGLNTESVQVGQRVQTIFEANALIGPYVNFKRHANTSPVAIFRAFMPASTTGFARVMMLEITAATKGTAEAYVQGLEKYMVTITLPEAATAGSGTHVAKILSSTKDAANLLADPAITIVANGYDSATDSTMYTIYHQVANATRLGDTVFTLTGCYMDNGLSRTTRGWKIQRM